MHLLTSIDGCGACFFSPSEGEHEIQSDRALRSIAAVVMDDVAVLDGAGGGGTALLGPPPPPDTTGVAVEDGYPAGMVIATASFLLQ